MGGAVEDLVGGSVLDNLSGVHDCDPVCHVGHNTEVMGDEYDREVALLLQFVDQLQDLGLDCDIQGGCGLVADQHIRVCRKGNGNYDTLAHSA